MQRPEGYEVQQYERDGLFGGVVDYVKRLGLGQGLTMRPAADIPRTNARSYEHPELKGMIDTSMHQQVDELGELWNRLGNDIMNFGASLYHTATNIDAVWKGEAGLVARNMLVKLAKWSQQTGQGVQYMGTTMRTQGDAAGKAKADMPDPVPYDPAVYQDQINSTSNPFQWIQILGDAREQYERHNAAHEEAIRVTETYSTSLHNTNGQMPAFAPPPEFGGGKKGGGPLPKGEGKGTGGDDPSGPGDPPPYDPGDPPKPGDPPPYDPGDPPRPGDPPPYDPDDPPGHGDPPPYDPGDPPRPGDPPPPRPGYPPGSDVPAPTPGQLAPHVPGIPGGSPGGVGPGGGGGTGVPGFLPAAAGLGGGGFGPTGGAGFGPTRGGESATGAGKGAAGPAGRGGGLGGAFPPMAGAGRGRGEEDTEHQRPSYLVETEDIWGDGRRVAPPVIGEDPPEYYPKGKR